MLILASLSPRRADLLKGAGFDFIVKGSNFDEKRYKEKNAKKRAQKLAELKAAAISSKTDKSGTKILAADTIVSFKGKIFNKPRDIKEAVKMLKQLQGKKHEVFTGVCIFDSNKTKQISWVSKTVVEIKKMSDKEIKDMAAEMNPLDKAGGYSITHLDSKNLIKSMDGSFANVMGLPIEEVAEKLNASF